MLGSHIIYLKGMRRMMFQLSGFYYTHFGTLTTMSPKRDNPRINAYGLQKRYCDTSPPASKYKAMKGKVMSHVACCSTS